MYVPEAQDLMTTLAPNSVYQNLFTGQPELYTKPTGELLMNLDVSSASNNPGVETFVQQVCPVVLNQEHTISTEVSGELKTTESGCSRPVRRFECNYCHKHYFSEANLQLHLDVVHRGLRRFQCTFCGKAYAKGFLLKSHIKSVHENIRDVTCTICQKAFSKRSVMRRHMKSVHAEKKDFHCEICQKQFTEKKNLQMHINALHIGLRPHQCDNCSKEFARKCDLLRHANSVHRESKPYMCPYCNKGFPQKWYFERHVASVHKISYMTSRQLQQPQQQQQQQQQHHTMQHQQIQQSQTQEQQQRMQELLQTQQQQHDSHHLLHQQQQQQLTVLQSHPHQQPMNLPMGTIIATPGTGPNAMPVGTQVMMVAPGMNMPMPAFFFQPQQTTTFTNPLNMNPAPTVLSPNNTNSLFRQNCPNSPTTLIAAPFRIGAIPMKPITVGQHQISPTAQSASPSTRSNKEYQCPTCSKFYPRRQSLQAHIVQVHTEKKPYECNLCHKGFVRRWDFYRHVNSVHQDNAMLAINEDKLEEYIAWMRGRRSCLDISWECLNAVRPDLARVKAENCGQCSGQPSQSQQQQLETKVDQSVTHFTPITSEVETPVDNGSSDINSTNNAANTNM